MYNAIKIMTTCLCAAALLASCGKSDERPAEARALLERAESLRAAHDYDGAVAVLDSVDKAYRDCLAERREGTKIRIQTLIDLSTDSLNVGESRREARQAAIDSLSARFITVSMPGTRGYRAVKDVFTGSEMRGTFVQPRIDDKDYFFVAVNNAGRRLNLSGVEFGDAVARGESVYMEGSEMMSLSQEAAADLARAISAAPAGAVTVYLVGDKGRTPVKLSARQAQALRDTWRYAMLLQEKTLDDIHFEKYSANIEKLQQQVASLGEAE